MSFTSEEIEEFRAEALELLDVAEKSLLSLDQGADFKIAFDKIFRSLHNLKGAAGLMEFTDLQSHTHELESIFMQFKTQTSIPKKYVDFFLRGIDSARLLLAGKKVSFDFNQPAAFAISPEATEKTFIKIEVPQTKNSKEHAVSESATAEFISECDEITERIAQVLQSVESDADPKESLEALYRDIHSLKGSAYLFSYNKLGDIAHEVESSLENIRGKNIKPDAELLNKLFQSLSLIEAEILNIKSKVKMPVVSMTAASTPTEHPLIASPDMQTHAQGISQGNGQGSDSDSNGSIRVPVVLLDNLMTLVGEMVLVRNQVLQFSNDSEDLSFLNLSKRLNVVTSEIQDEMMKTRMQPIGNIISKFNRVVRDLSQELKKEIQLNLIGAETELDKSLLEAIKDPLTHIVRNSCDHGIEAPDVRLAAGKSKNGLLNIKSYHEGGQVVVEITDDGAGLDKEVILKKALEKGLVTHVQSQAMSEKEIFNLIFAPGFSTAKTVTNVSGRGVGMDVVRTNVEKIGGTVDLSSVLGKGTTTKLKIPLTLAIIPALIVKSGTETFAIPQVKLEELVRVDQASAEQKIEYLHGLPVYRLRGRILPLIDLNGVLGLPLKSDKVIHNIVVLNADQISFGVIIDEIQDTADIVVKPINRLLRSLQVYSGATILGDGSIALIIDVPGLAKRARIGLDKANETAVGKIADVSAIAETQEFLIVRLKTNTKHALVLSYVHRLEEVKSSQIEFSAGQRVIRYGKVILQLISVSEQLGYSDSKNDVKETVSVVVVEKGGILYGLEVEEIVDTLSTDVETDTTLIKKPGVFGNLNTADSLIVVIDPFEIIHSVFSNSAEPVDVQRTVSAKPKSNLNILLVEDTVFFRRNVAKILEKAGHQVSVAVDGLDAIATLEKNPRKFDLIISDIEMPRMNGFEFAKAIRANKNFISLPLLALSSRADKNFRDQGLAAGFDTYLEKLQPDTLLEAINGLVQPNKKAV